MISLESTPTRDVLPATRWNPGSYEKPRARSPLGYSIKFRMSVISSKISRTYVYNADGRRKFDRSTRFIRR